MSNITALIDHLRSQSLREWRRNVVFLRSRWRHWADQHPSHRL